MRYSIEYKNDDFGKSRLCPLISPLKITFGAKKMKAFGIALQAILLVNVALAKKHHHKNHHKNDKNHPPGPLVPGAIFKQDLLQGGEIGAFTKEEHPAKYVNNEEQIYIKDMVWLDKGVLTIKADRGQDWKTYSGRVNSYGKWSTSWNGHNKRGYVEVRTTLPATNNDGERWKYKGSWPAVWMLGSGVFEGTNWPTLLK